LPAPRRVICGAGFILVSYEATVVRVGMIHAGLAVLASFTSIQPDSRVMTIGAVSEFFLAALVKLSFTSIEVVVELFMALSFLRLSSQL
jgi:hypothetical protein